jgi:hypothetical protein
MRRKRVVALGSVAGVALLLWYLFEYGVPAGTATVYVDGKPEKFPVYKPIFYPGRGTIENTEDGWLHIKGDHSFVVLIPNYTRVIVYAKILSNPRNASNPVQVARFCGWGEQPQAYGINLNERFPKAEFVGCKPAPGYKVKLEIYGKRYSFTPPGSLLVNVYGEALVKIEVYP